MGFIDVTHRHFIDQIPKELDDLKLFGPLTLGEGGKVNIELRPDLDFETIRGQAGVPALVTRGIVRGFTLPIYAADNQELFLSCHIPIRWDGTSDLEIHIGGYLDTANDGKNFQLRIAYESFNPGVGTVPDTSTNIDVETATGTAAQYQSYEIKFTIPRGSMAPSDLLTLRVYRIAASGDEIVGNFVVSHVGLIFVRDKLGDPV